MVNPEQQGKGTGKQILEHLEERAKRLGYTDIILNTWDTALVAFYIHNDYKEVGRIPRLIANERKLYDFYLTIWDDVRTYLQSIDTREREFFKIVFTTFRENLG